MSELCRNGEAYARIANVAACMQSASQITALASLRVWGRACLGSPQLYDVRRTDHCGPQATACNLHRWALEPDSDYGESVMYAGQKPE